MDKKEHQNTHAGSNEESVSLNKFISETGICSRREADKIIAEQRVTINNKPTKTGNRVFAGDVVRIDGKPILSKPRPIYIAFNKPPGIVCTTDLRERHNIISFINHPERLFPVGRLDKASEGLILLTNDGDIVNKILRAGNQHEKEYIVSVKERITKNFITRMAGGIPILGTMTQPCFVEKLNDHTFRIILTQGLNRQIRRMCEFLQYNVTRLQRIRIMHIDLGTMAIGTWRNLTSEEISTVQRLVKSSVKTEEASLRKHPKSRKRKKLFNHKNKDV